MAVARVHLVRPCLRATLAVAQIQQSSISPPSILPAAGLSNRAEVAALMCTALGSGAGAAFLSSLAWERQLQLCTAICIHGG